MDLWYPYITIVSITSDCEQLTTASRYTPTPTFVGHASTCVVSLQGVSSVAGVGHCGSKGCTRATSLTICRSIRGWTTAGACRGGTGTTFPVATMQAHAIQCKLKDMKVYSHAQSCKQINILCIHKTMHVYARMHHTHQYRHGACEYMYLHGHTNYSGLVNTRVGHLF